VNLEFTLVSNVLESGKHGAFFMSRSLLIFQRIARSLKMVKVVFQSVT
jgi:hypothetical protein